MEHIEGSNSEIFVFNNMIKIISENNENYYDNINEPLKIVRIGTIPERIRLSEN